MEGIQKGWLGVEVLDRVTSWVKVKIGSRGGRKRGGREGVSVDFRKRGRSSGEFRRCGRTYKWDFGMGKMEGFRAGGRLGGEAQAEGVGVVGGDSV